MVPKFIPVALDAISPTIDVTDAINELSGFKTHNLSIIRRWADDFVTLKIDGEMMSEEEGRPKFEARRAVYKLATGRVLDALRSGLVSSYVMRASDNTFWRIPSAYYNRQKVGNMPFATLVEWLPDSGEQSSMYDQPILLSERQFGAWLSDQARGTETLRVDGFAEGQSDLLAAEGEHSHALSAKPLAKSALRKWITAQNKNGASLNSIIHAARTTFPDHASPSRARIVDIDRSVRLELGLPPRQRGRPKIT